MTLYEVLGVDPESTSAEIEIAFKKRRGNRYAGFLEKIAVSLELHADVDYAYAVLSNCNTRKKYDTSPDEFLEFHAVAIVI